MTKFVLVGLETPIELKENSVASLNVENGSYFYDLVCEIKKLFNGENSFFSFWYDGKMTNPSKSGELIDDFFDFGANDKKILNLLYKRIDSATNACDGIVKMNEINEKIYNLYADVFHDLPFLLDSSALTVTDLLKATDVKFVENYSSFVEKFVCYVNILAELKNVNFLVCVNLKSVCSHDDFTEIFKHCQREKISLFLIESGPVKYAIPEERAIIITEDLCEIVENIKGW